MGGVAQRGQSEPQASVFSRASCCLCAGPSGGEGPCWGVWWASAKLGLGRQCYQSAARTAVGLR